MPQTMRELADQRSVWIKFPVGLSWTWCPLFVLLLLLGQLIGKTVSTDKQGPLLYHHSPWLHKEFLTGHMQIVNKTGKVSCGEMFHEKTESSCQSTEDCRAFIPSAYCSRIIHENRSQLRKAPNFTIEELKNLRSSDGEQSDKKFRQCHYLTESLIVEMCNETDRSNLENIIKKLHLRSCRRFSLERSLSDHLLSLTIKYKECCEKILREMLMLDELVEELACEYESILRRYDCQAKWSVKWKCRDCKLAYRDWICSMMIPYHIDGQLVKPCQSVCEQVEQKCPHLHPYGKEQYAGEPVFLCIDPNIPFNSNLTPDIPFGNESNCYDSCQLEFCESEYKESPVLNCQQDNFKAKKNITQATTITTASTSDYPTGEDFSTTVSLDDEHESTVTLDLDVQPTVVDIGLKDNYLDDTKLTSTTSQWSTDDSINKIVDNGDQSTQPSLKEPEGHFEDEMINDQYQLDQYGTDSDNLMLEDNTENAPTSTQEPSSLQEIYREALVSTTIDPVETSNEQVDNDILLNEEIIKEDMSDDWTTSNTVTTSTINSIDFTLKSVPTGTEATNETDNSLPKSENKNILNGQQRGENSSGNRFRHYNSRNKDTFVQQKVSTPNNNNKKGVEIGQTPNSQQTTVKQTMNRSKKLFSNKQRNIQTLLQSNLSCNSMPSIIIAFVLITVNICFIL